MAKRYTRAQWEQLQSSFPMEDRTPYELSPDAVVEENVAVPVTQPINTITSTSIDPYYVRDPKTGLSPAQVEAQKALQEAQAANQELGIVSKVVATPGSAGSISTPPTEGLKAGYEWYAFNLPGGGFEWRQKPTKATLTNAYTTLFSDSPSTSNPTTSNPNIPSGLDAATISLIQSLQNQIDTLTKKTTTPAVDLDRAERQSAFEALRLEMAAIGLEALVEPLRGLIEKNVAPSEFTIRLRESEAYKQRFAANDVRIKKGLRVLSPGEYLRVEDAYRQTLRTYGLRQFDNDEYVRQFIENDISAAELSDRVSMAVQRVQNADPAIARTLKDYYGIDQSTLVGYVLDPNQQLQKIQRQIAAAEIGTAARLQGIQPGVAVAEQLAAQGITEAEAQKGYSTIADVLPTAEKLSGLYGKSMETYGLAEGEQDVFNTLASAQRKRKNLIGREIAEFGGQSGIGRGSLSTAMGGQY
jgi:hypothetical protein